MRCSKLYPKDFLGASSEALRQDVAPPEWHVYTDTPGSAVCYENGIVGFDNTNVIVHARSRRAQIPEHVGPLSILFSVNGSQIFEIDKARYALDDNVYLVHNLQQSVSGSIESETEVDSFTIGFWPGFAEDALRSLVTPADRLLDEPRASKRQPVHFFTRTYPHDRLVSPLLFTLYHAMGQPWITHSWLEEQNHRLVERLLLAHREIGREIEQLPAARPSTRVETYQRLHRARDFMRASLHEPIDLAQIAEVAWFSPHHFLRQFKLAFHETPHQYLTRLRLQRAQWLLLKTDMPVTDVCLDVGFESLGSFSWLFRRKFGVSPEKFRLRERAAPSWSLAA